MIGPFKDYEKDWLKFDILAGLTTAAVVMPKAMAFAVIAGLPVQTGLYVALVPMLAYALLGTSRTLSVSSTTTIALLTATQLGLAVPDGNPVQMLAAAATLAMLTGAFLLLAGLLRLGFLANFISDPVLTGFKAGIGLVIVVDQVPKMLGIHIDKGSFFDSLVSIIQHIPEAHEPTLLLGGILLVIMFGLEHFVPRLPAPLVVVVLGIVAAAVFGLRQMGVALIGPIPTGMSLPSVPDMSPSMLWTLFPGALGIALMSFVESIAAARSFVRQDDPRPVPNRELIALGAANLAAGIFQAIPAGGGTSQTSVNTIAGARSQIAEIVTVTVVLATLFFLSPLISLLQLAALATVVIVTTLPLLKPTDFQKILHIRRTEFVWAIIACASVVLLGTLTGIMVAVIISILTLFYQAANPLVYQVGRKSGTEIYRPLSDEHPEDETLPGLLILRTEGRLNFVNAPHVGERMWPIVRKTQPHVIIIECSAIPDIEYTALQALASAEEKLRAEGIALWLSALNPEAFKVVKRSPLGKALGHERIFFSLHEAVNAYEKLGLKS